MTTTTLNEYLINAQKAVKKGRMKAEHAVLKTGPVTLQPTRRGYHSGGEFAYHGDPKCYSINNKQNSVTVPGESDYNFCYCSYNSDLDFDRLNLFVELANFQTLCVNAKKYKGKDNKLLKKRLNDLEGTKNSIKFRIKEFNNFHKNSPVSTSYNKTTQELIEIFEEVLEEAVENYYNDAVKHLNTSMVTDEAVNLILNEAKKFLQNGTECSYFDEAPTLVGLYASEGSLTHKLTAIVTAFTKVSTQSHMVLIMPRYVYDYLQREIYRSNTYVKWVGSVNIENVDESIIDTAISLWDPATKGGVSNLHETLELAKVI